MAGEPQRVPSIRYAKYLALKRREDARHEWLDGQVYAMAGGTLAHAELATAIGAELRALARSCGCRVFTADAKVRVLDTGLATYHDGSVVCGAVERDPDDDNALTNPALLVEVCFEDTERWDRGDKADRYRRIPTLKDYLLVSQHTARIEIHSRAGDPWVLRVAGPGESVPLTAMPGAHSIDRVFQGVALNAAPPRDRRSPRGT